MGKTTIFQWPWPEETGVTPDVPRDVKALLEAQEARLKVLEKLVGTPSAAVTPEPGQLVVVDGTGHPAYKAATGDAAVNSSGVVTIADAAVTSRKFKPTIGVKAASGDLTLESAYADVPGTTLEITPAVASLLAVTATFHIDLASGPSEGYGTISLDGTDQTPYAQLEYPAGTDGAANCTQVYLLTLTAALHVIKMRGKKGATNGGFIRQNHSRFLYTLLAS